MAEPSRHVLSTRSAPSPTTAGAPSSTPRALLTSIRPEQWTKNLLVFAGLLFGQRLFEPQASALAAGAFVVFCALSSAVYLVNDVVDRGADQLHPVKMRRPIASGALPVRTALSASAVMAGVALVAAVALGRGFFLAASAYLLLQAAYSGPLKHVVILDVLAIAAGFVLRAAAGAFAIAVPISAWLLVCTILLALFLALAKRRQEIVALASDAKSHRRILAEYSPYLLDQMIAIVAAATIMAYALYTVSPETAAKFGTEALLLTLPFPIYGIFRYLYLVHQKQGGGSPSDLLLQDRPLLVCVLLWGLAVVSIVYDLPALPF
jgi:4-hydroxybenzoate polyprenyltransferase